MMFVVFVGFYLYSDHAPWWVWALAAAGLAYDLLETRGERIVNGYYQERLLRAVRWSRR